MNIPQVERLRAKDIDLVRKGAEYAVCEAKAGKGLSSLKTYGLRQGSREYNVSRLERYLRKEGANAALARELLSQADAGQLKSYAAFARGRKVYELPNGWPQSASAIRR